MHLDPTEVFFHTVARVPVRIGLAWIVGLLGALAPALWLVLYLIVTELMERRWQFFAQLNWDFFSHVGLPLLILILMFPIFLVIATFTCGWWAWIAFPLFCVFVWRLVVFVREGFTSELFWLFILPYLINIKIAGDWWPLAILPAAILIFFVVRWQLIFQHRYS